MSTRQGDLIDPSPFSQVSRRNFLDRMARLSANAMVAPFILDALSLRVLAAEAQDNWRLCSRCYALFVNGFPNKGRCPAGGGHEAQGYNFLLRHDVPESGKAQGAWRFCHKCNTMYFDGYPRKGACPAGEGHVAAGYIFVLPHDIPVSGLTQGAWRFCNKCYTMFFDGYRRKGRCPVGGGHVAQGFNFVLRFRGNLEGDVQLNPVRE